MQEIRASFFVECEELLEALQDGLGDLETEASDSETINVVFRAVHSIKGGAGAFGLDDLVGFAHSFETVLDEVRSDRLDPTPELIRLFFRCADVLSDLVRASRDDAAIDAASVAAVLAELEAASGGVAATVEDEAVDFTPAAISLDLDLALPPLDLVAPGRRYRIDFRPEPALYTSGNEPLFLLRALASLGETTVAASLDDPPSLSDYDPDSSLLAWTIELATERDEADIREVFDFVDGLCTLTITELGPDAPEAEQTPAPPPPAAPVAVEAAPAPEVSAPKTPPAPPAADAGTPPAPADAAPTDAADRSGPPGRAAAQPGATVRVDLDRIERLVNLVGELVINQAMLSQSFAEAGLAGDTQIAAGLDEFLQLTRDIQDSVMMIRAQPVKSLFQRMGRIVRESSDAVGKSVRLVTEGESTEIDKTMIERLSDPLTHMIRNAVDHGLEKPDDRVAAGKPRQGTVTLTAGHRSGRVVIEVSDDGGGINRPRVQAIAEEKGLIPKGLALAEAEIDNLLFLPGFSTASQVSNLSGRGVGMDVVKSAISSLGGRIGITSVPGEGTRFSISLPLTLAVLDGMVIRCCGETLVVPLSAIVETLTLRDDHLTSVGPSAIAVRVRDTFVPLIDLAAQLGYGPPRKAYGNAIALLITQDDGARAALVVDSILDQRQVVIKGLEHSYGRVPGVAAATILGDGQIALILDPTDLMSRSPGRGSGTVLFAEAG